MIKALKDAKAAWRHGAHGESKVGDGMEQLAREGYGGEGGDGEAASGHVSYDE